MSLHCLGTKASAIVHKDVGYTLGCFENGLEKCSEVLVATAAPKMQPILVAMSRGSCQNGLEKRWEVLVARAPPKTQPILVAISWELSGHDASGSLEEIFHAMLLAIFEIHPAT